MKLFDPAIPYLHWLLRGALGTVFLYHGLTKFPVLEGMATMLGLSVTVVLLVALAETLGGALILIGGFGYDWMTRAGAALLIPIMLGAIATVHWGQWSFVPSETHPMGGIEFQVVLLLLQGYFLAAGNRATVVAEEDIPSAEPSGRKRRQVA